MIKELELKEIKELKNNEYDYLILQGCGGNSNEWIDGITDMLKSNDIVPFDFKFNEIYKFKKDDLTNLAFALNDKNINMEKLAIFRLSIRDDFGAMWLSDYVDNYLKDINMDGGFKKVKAKIIGVDSNVFNLIGICTRSLKENGYSNEAKELQQRVTSSKSFDEALQIMMDYVVPVDQYGYEFGETNLFDYADVDIQVIVWKITN